MLYGSLGHTYFEETVKNMKYTYATDGLSRRGVCVGLLISRKLIIRY